MEIQPEVMNDSKPLSKPPIIRGARACTVCRIAKMKCVGAEDGQKPCDRCRRANVECVFEKHRRGRKPGSKLSEASKMLRRLEKGLNSAKMKSQTTDARLLDQDVLFSGGRSADGRYNSSGGHFTSKELPSLGMSTYAHDEGYAHPPRSGDVDEEEDPDRNEDAIFPQKVIKQENQRTSFFRTILNPEASPTPNDQSAQNPSLHSRSASFTTSPQDPITAGIVTEEEAKVLFDHIFIRLNPFINLFDPALHTVPYVRSKCNFLFTTLIMAGCKFFKPDSFKQCQKLANAFAVQAFAEAWKRVEVVQAFACLTYWKDPEDNDNRTWTYIGYACRMAVELKLNRYVSHPANETELQRLERRNRERTYLVLFVHDRSLSTQTGMPWMLHEEDEIIRQSNSWHKQGGSTVRPEDVIVAAFITLRCIAAETTDVLKGRGTRSVASDVNTTEVVLRECNDKLSKWADFWQHEMDQANGENFHSSFLRFFRLYVSLFLNSFGIHTVTQPSGHLGRSLHPISICCTSALDSLKIVSEDFADLHMLPYGQESLMVMSAYSAVSLLRILRSRIPAVDAQLTEISAHEIHTIIAQTAKAYEIASQISSQSTSTSVHARFLRHLLAYDHVHAQQTDRKHSHGGGMSIDPQLQSSITSIPTDSTPQVHHEQYQLPALPHACQEQGYGVPFYSRNDTQSMGGSTAYYYAPQAPQGANEADTIYWKHMFLELGFGDNQGNQVALPQTGLISYVDTDKQLQHFEPTQGRSPYTQHVHQSSQMGIYGQ